MTNLNVHFVNIIPTLWDYPVTWLMPGNFRHNSWEAVFLYFHLCCFLNIFFKYKVREEKLD